MKHLLGKAGFVLLALLVLGACSPRDRGIADMVPAEAVAFAQISDLESFIKNLQGFADSVGLKDMLPISSIKDLLSVGLGGTGAGLSLDDFDQTKPLGIAVLPPQTGSEDPGLIVYIPFKKVEESSVKFGDFLKSSGTEVGSYQANGYGIFSISTPALTFPPAKTFATPDYLVLEKGGISLYGDVAGLLDRYATEWQAMRAEALQSFEAIEAEQTGLPGSNVASGKAVVNAIFDTFEQAQGTAFHIRADAKGLSSRFQLGVTKGGSLDTLIQKAGSGSNLTGAASYVPAAYLMGGAAQAEPALWEDLSKSFIDLYTKDSSLSDADKAFMMAIMADYATFAGKQSTFAFDMEFDPQAMAAIGEDFSQLDKAFTIKTLVSMDSKDPKAYVAHIKKVIADPAFDSYLKDAFKSTGLALSLVVEDKKNGDLEYIRVSYKLDISDLAGLDPSDPAAIGVQTSKALFERLVLNIAAKGSKIYMTIDDPEGTELKTFAESDKVEAPLADNADWKEFAGTVPADAQYFGYFSVPRVLDLVSGFDPSGATAVDIPPEARTGLYGYLRAKDAVVEGQVFWSAKEIAPIVKGMGQLLPALLGGM